MRNTVRVNGENIRVLREKVGGSQEWLAEAVGVDVGTVSRWERGEIGNIKRNTLGKLCEALQATEAEICSTVAPTESGSIAPQPAQKGQMNLSIDTACRNTLALVADRYGVTRQQIVEIAPLLFFIAAEESLQARRERLVELRESATARLADEMGQVTSKFGSEKRYALRGEADTVLDNAEFSEDWLEKEETSIEQQDLFGSLYDRGFPPEGYEFLFCLENNHFADALTKALRTVLPESKPVEWEYRRWGYGRPNYRICEEEAGRLVGGDQEAVERILSGVVALYEMPADVRRASPAERAQWVLSESRLLAAEPENEGHFIPAVPIGIEL